MNYAFIDYTKKPSLLTIKPKIYSFDSGHNLYVFPGKCNKKRLKKTLSRYSYKNFSFRCTSVLKEKIWCKTIVQCMKEYNLCEATLCSDNYEDYTRIIEYFFRKNFNFSIITSEDSDRVTQYFLEKYGFPVRTKNYVKNGLIAYLGGPVPKYSNNVKILDLCSSFNCKKIAPSEYIIKGAAFPFIIDSLDLLEGALIMTEKETEDIIVKLSIFG